jgi:hypothetical protein
MALLSQTLIATSYPLEIVEAARWSKANPNFKGDAAVTAVKDQSWDVSIKSLVAFPAVLMQLNAIGLEGASASTAASFCRKISPCCATIAS